MFEHACRMGLEGIVEQAGSLYQSGRSRAGVKAKNPDAPAVTRWGIKAGGLRASWPNTTLQAIEKLH